MSKLDHIYRRILLTKFFTKGWGKPEYLKRIFEFRKLLSDRDACKKLVKTDHPIHITRDVIQSDCRIMEGFFQSPFMEHLPGIMPSVVENANFQVILPKKWKDDKLKPVCIHLAGTGDHFYWRRRRFMAQPLLKEAGIASIILESPYYGKRKPKSQLRSSLHNVSDLFVMGAAIILESRVLLQWCEKQGWGPLGLTGISMGGHMASLAATSWDKPITLVPCLSWSTASIVFTQGVMSGAIPWELLAHQYFENSIYQTDIKPMLHSPEEKMEGAYTLGRHFVTDFSKTSVTNEELDHVLTKTEHTEQSTAHKGVDVNTVHAINSRNFSSSAKFHGKIGVGKKSKYINADLLRKYFGEARSKLLNFSNEQVSTRRSKVLKDEAVEFMRGVMDECTHLGNFPVPVDPELIIILAAEQDAYVPRHNVLPLDQLWPGSQVRYISRGHIAAFLLDQQQFRRAIIEGFSLQIKKYYS